jgi:hypothetical protein
MPPKAYLHEHTEFVDLINIVADEMKIDPYLVEKDYWIMHCLYSLQAAGYDFQLKGGTSLSKGFCLIHRFSEDIDLHISPPEGLDVKTGKNHTKSQHRESRKAYYDYLADTIEAPGITSVERDYVFDSLPHYFSGGIRLNYDAACPSDGSAKEGILLEVGFDAVVPNQPIDISSWAYDFAASKNVDIIDNRAVGISCYDPAYTLVEKLQAVATKFRKQQEGAGFPPNFMRHYYDIYCLLQSLDVQEFIGTHAYNKHKEDRFPKQDLDIPINKNEAFLLTDPNIRALYKKEYERRPSLYYSGQVPFEDILATIGEYVDRL